MSMEEWLRPVAPIALLIGGFLLLDQSASLIADGPYHLGQEAERMRFALLASRRLASITIGCLLVGESIVVLGHRRGLKPWRVIVGTSLLLALTATAMALFASLNEPLSLPEYASPIHGRLLQGQVIATSLAAIVALAWLLRITPGAGRSRALPDDVSGEATPN
jgi:hypothetical protein